MAKDAFFTMRVPFTSLDDAQFDTALRTSKHIRNVLYSPDVLEQKRIEGITFENVSFSKTDIRKCTFKDCIFEGCLFIGASLEDVEFHGCEVRDCNFFKATIARVYGRPSQFAAAIREHKYANVAVHLYQELRDNYLDEMQPEYRQEAEYFFKLWKRRLHWNEMASSKDKPRHFLGWFLSFMYGLLFGYGYRLRNLAATTVAVVATLSVLSHAFHGIFFEPNGPVSFVRSVYFTVSTMVTMGAVGYTPVTDFGYLFVLVNALAGVLLITATVNALAKRVAR